MSSRRCSYPKIYPSSLPMGQALTSGEISAGSFVQIQDSAKASGAPVDSGLSDTVWGAIFNGAVTANAPHPNAGKLLADFALSPQGQQDLAHLLELAPVGEPATNGRCSLDGIVVDTEYGGSHIDVSVDAGDARVLARMPTSTRSDWARQLQPGDAVEVSFDPCMAKVFPGTGVSTATALLSVPQRRGVHNVMIFKPGRRES